MVDPSLRVTVLMHVFAVIATIRSFSGSAVWTSALVAEISSVSTAALHRKPAHSIRRFSGCPSMRRFSKEIEPPPSDSLSPINDIRHGQVWKELWILRHGQATHNVRAEEAKTRTHDPCTFEEFLQLMREDDELDAPLTPLGHQQAQLIFDNHHILGRSNDNGVDGGAGHVGDDMVHDRVASPYSLIELIVSSPLSRAIQTADGAFPPTVPSLKSSSSNRNSESKPSRICHETFREVNGDLLNGKRQNKTILSQTFPHWNVHDFLVHEEDILWTPEELESFDSVRERGYLGLHWLMEHRDERRILLVAHGGLLVRFVQGNFLSHQRLRSA
jgi:broad specificity phosphatase PhoE